MKAELSEQKLQVAMHEYLEETSHAAFVNGLVWTSPERVCQFAAGLGDALAEVIFDSIPMPVDVVPVVTVEAEVIEEAVYSLPVEADQTGDTEAALLARERELSSRPV